MPNFYAYSSDICLKAWHAFCVLLFFFFIFTLLFLILSDFWLSCPVIYGSNSSAVCFLLFFFCVCNACIYHYSSLLSKQSYLGAVPASIFDVWDKEQDLATLYICRNLWKDFVKNEVVYISFSSCISGVAHPLSWLQYVVEFQYFSPWQFYISRILECTRHVYCL